MASNTSQLFPSHAGGREFGAFSDSGWCSNEFHTGKVDFDAPVGSSMFSATSQLNRLLSAPCSLPNLVLERQPLASEDVEGDDIFGSMQELESHALGTLLPDAEEDLLADSGYNLGSLHDDEFDFFNSGGGMELEGDIASTNGNFTGNVLAGEHPYGEHPSRTLFVRNINSNVEDAELRALFEQYGDIRTLYTACKHRGFVMISYYDIRAARSAMRGLQNKPLRRRKLDIHFSIPKDNPSDKDVNQGTLVVFNLDTSVTNDDLRQIFGVYGEIKEIRETPHKKHHKFIEFYDVRAAEAALRALNRSDIAGKRIKLEPSRPGGARRSLMQQLTHELEQEEFRCQQMQTPLDSSPSGQSPHWGSSTLRMNDPGIRAVHSSFGSFASQHPNGVGSVPARVSSPLHVNIPDSLGRSSGHFMRQQFSSLQISDQDPTSFGVYDQRRPSSLREVSASLDHSPRVLTGTRITEQSLWSNSSPFHSQLQSFVGDRHLDSTRASMELSAAFADRKLVDGHNGFFTDLPGMSWSGPVGGLNMKGSNQAFSGLVDSSRLGPLYRTGPFVNGAGSLDNFSERCKSRRGEISAGLAENKKYQLDLERILLGNDLRTTLMIKNIPNKYTSKLLLSTIDEHHRGTYDFIYLPIDFKVILGEQKCFPGIDRLLPVQNKCNVGYAFINMTEPAHIVPFYKSFNGKKWEKFNSEKVASLAYARIQGKAALVAHFQNSSLMNEDKRCRPILFPSENNPQHFCAARPEPAGNCQFEISSL
ncbi:protein MEI2-like 2 isoform X1 [Selaginella moellendorffii]|uniref:protein MEI2-like 2 isoform X1 n=1 Tax=Selaginella moellendorffii TaxID=88036 RepID=UPI000D1C6C4A|nr:protein MEI2-like 2 isoform X1 [Selaginella moellendorffii]|eukprot:XP_024531526.1 protein MEI2-like 2 isoform X1 [Selaginella moellendorffii]